MRDHVVYDCLEYCKSAAHKARAEVRHVNARNRYSGVPDRFGAENGSANTSGFKSRLDILKKKGLKFTLI